MLPLPMPGSCFWPEKEAGILPLPVFLLSVTRPHLGAFCTEEGFISWVGYPEWGDLLGLGERSQKREETRKLQVGPLRAQAPPSRVAIARPTLGSHLLSSRDYLPILPLHAWLLSAHSLCLGLCYPPLCKWGLERGPIGVPQPSPLA